MRYKGEPDAGGLTNTQPTALGKSLPRAFLSCHPPEGNERGPAVSQARPFN